MRSRRCFFLSSTRILVDVWIVNFTIGCSFRHLCRAGSELTGALVGILALPLPLMEWIHIVRKFAFVHQFVYDIVHSTGIYGSSFLHLIVICVLAICRSSPNWSLPRCLHVILPKQCTTNRINSLATEVIIRTLLLLMILFKHSYRFSGVINI